MPTLDNTPIAIRTGDGGFHRTGGCLASGGISVPAEGFAQLVKRAQRGDADALERLLREYSDAIRREVRFCLLDSRLRRVVGESDIYQSVVTRFALQLREGEFAFDQPDDLVKLLKTMARARVAELARFWQAQRRDVRRNESLGPDAGEQHAGHEPTPSSVIGTAELIAQALSRLSHRDRQIILWRQDGIDWSEITSQLGETNSETVRRQHQRALDRAAHEMSADE